LLQGSQARALGHAIYACMPLISINLKLWLKFNGDSLYEAVLGIGFMIRKFLKDEGGNVAIMFSGLVMLLLGGVGVAVDISQMVSAKQKAADIADSTALAAALVAREGNEIRMKTANDHFKSNASFDEAIEIKDNVIIDFDDSIKEVTVTVSAKTNFFLMHMFGHAENDITASSTVGYAIDYVPPISIAFAFDTSGSMGWDTTDGQVKIDALEAATGDLFGAMFSASENPTLLQGALSTAFSTYNTELVINDPVRSGYNHILTTMRDDPLFIATGGTNSGPSVQFAVDQLIVKQAAETDSKWSGNLIFMTDGDNNDPEWDTDTLAICDDAKARGYTIYTVAFAAPKKGKDLLEACASDKKLAFKSKNAKKLKESFEFIGQQLGEATVRIKR